MIDKFSLLFYNESKLGGVEMHPGFDKYMMQLRMESKEQENQEKTANHLSRCGSNG